MRKYPKDDWSKYDACGTCSKLKLTKHLAGVCTNPKSEHFGQDMPCWYGCKSYEEVKVNVRKELEGADNEQIETVSISCAW